MTVPASETPNEPTNATPNANAGGSAGANAGGSADKENWTTAQWEKHVQSESDRRMSLHNDSLKRKEADFQTLIADNTRTADEKLKQYEADLQTERTRSDFYADAQKNGVADVRAAWAVAREEKLLANGRVHWDDIKTAHPALFSKVTATPAGRANDVGTDGKINMTALLRRQAKR